MSSCFCDRSSHHLSMKELFDEMKGIVRDFCIDYSFIKNKSSVVGTTSGGTLVQAYLGLGQRINIAVIPSDYQNVYHFDTEYHDDDTPTIFEFLNGEHHDDSSFVVVNHEGQFPTRQFCTRHFEQVNLDEIWPNVRAI